MSQISPPQTIHLPQGFSFSAVTAGIKVSGRLDLSLIEASAGATAAAMFTKNRVVAAPVEIGRQALAISRGRVRAVIINSGNANCATGKPGLKACQRICRETAKLLGVRSEEIFPSSTGIIGVPLPAEKIVNKLPDLIAARQSSEEGIAQLAKAIMTTDTRPKLASAQFRSGNSMINLTGVAKGSGMIHPQLATMLVYILSDVSATPAELKHLLREACDESFNCISVDGDTSTNDTVLVLASGKSGTGLKNPKVRDQFSAALREVCQSLANQIVADGEGVQHIIRLHIEQAKNRHEALHVARAIAHSLLVKTAWAGADPNWGRILSAAGACGLLLDPNCIDIYIGKQRVCRNGVGFPFDEAEAHRGLSQQQCDIRIILRRGIASIIFQTTDLTAEYVRINADYST
ncbi:MAG TPA: bifunctional glutamate N-acetyltransferase/amino-acid acetyltransferase ArgJ [Terriglobales bacterium]|nr:bifunctional glutamate N-acetyltransferase/amino-acid acetyltransferase ArgJ [Terriglobales bacterium]